MMIWDIQFGFLEVGNFIGIGVDTNPLRGPHFMILPSLITNFCELVFVSRLSSDGDFSTDGIAEVFEKSLSLLILIGSSLA